MGVKKIRCCILRGGTSKGIYLHESDLPPDPEQRAQTILKIFGTPDPWQIDGLGGTYPQTSKLAIIAPSDSPDYDVRYTYNQVGITEPKLYTRGICGNISSGVGPFAIDEGLVKVVEPITTVRIYNTNTKRILVAKVPVRDGKAEVYGDFGIPGVPGTGARIDLDFSDTEGAATGKLLPTGNVRDVLSVKGIGDVEVSIVDSGTVQCFVRASDLGLRGTESPPEIEGNAELMERLHMIRGTAAHLMGFCSSPESARVETANSPHLVIASPPQDYHNYQDGTLIPKESVNIVGRMLFMTFIAPAYAGTGSLCTATASRIEGTLAHEVMVPTPGSSVVRLGHPTGVIEIESVVDKNEDGFKLRRLAISRTARRIMDGWVYIKG